MYIINNASNVHQPVQNYLPTGQPNPINTPDGIPLPDCRYLDPPLKGPWMVHYQLNTS